MVFFTPYARPCFISSVSGTLISRNLRDVSLISYFYGFDCFLEFFIFGFEIWDWGLVVKLKKIHAVKGSIKYDLYLHYKHMKTWKYSFYFLQFETKRLHGMGTFPKKSLFRLEFQYFAIHQNIIKSMRICYIFMKHFFFFPDKWRHFMCGFNFRLYKFKRRHYFHSCTDARNRCTHTHMEIFSKPLSRGFTLF